MTSKFELESRRGFLRFLATSPLLAYPGLGFAQESRPISDPKDAINVFDFHEAAKETLPVAHYKGQSPRTMTWDFVKRLQDTTTMKVYIKGIVTGEDAALCVDDGIDGIVVSNHGGRAEASTRGTIECLAEITDAVCKAESQSSSTAAFVAAPIFSKHSPSAPTRSRSADRTCGD